MSDFWGVSCVPLPPQIFGLFSWLWGIFFTLFELLLLSHCAKRRTEMRKGPGMMTLKSISNSMF